MISQNENINLLVEVVSLKDRKNPRQILTHLGILNFRAIICRFYC